MASQDPTRDRILASIDRHLGKIANSLEVIAKNSKTTTTTMHIPNRPNAFDVPQEPQPDPGDTKVEARKDEPGPVFPKSDNPYFEKRTPLGTDNGPNPDRDFPLGA